MKLINYPAMASPQSIQIIEQNVSKYLVKGSKVIDPFCGTSRLLFSARMQGHHITGFDCSPVAILTSRVCNQKINLKKIKAEKEKILKIVNDHILKSDIIVTEEERFWYPQKTFYSLVALLNAVDESCSSVNTRRFFWLVLVDVARSASYTREEEYKSHRIPEAMRQVHSPNILDLFAKYYDLLIKRLASRDMRNAGGYRFILGDIADKTAPVAGYNALICSPPYGNSVSTVGYGQFARIPLLLLYRSLEFSYEFPSSLNKVSIDTLCLGGRQCSSVNDIRVPQILQHIRKGPMYKFSKDYFFRLQLLSRLLKKRSLACLVLADRTYEGKKYPLIKATEEYMRSFGFSLLKKHDRYLTGKRLPRTMSKSRSTSIQSHEGMNYESVLIFKR
ncbi:MAG: methyltransferase domain-containing protein [Candidatus Thiodiazotropha endolucinida]